MNLFSIFKTFAFKTDPERIHDLSINSFSNFPQISSLLPHAINDKKFSLSDNHMTWSYPVGLAAGFDKNAKALEYFARVGFGSLEIGTVTKEPQVGNPKPRIWRDPETRSIRNAMGFPNEGSQKILARVEKRNITTPVGVNIGKNKETSISDTPQEYAYLYEMFAKTADYLVINISSPNTPGLRDLQTKESFRDICQAVAEKRNILSKPLYLKISPDLNHGDIKDLVELSKEYNLSGIIATNTTIQHSFDKGGVSGGAIKTISQQIRKTVCEMTRETPNLSVIGVGGIDSFSEINDFWKQGGSFVQLYSSFIFHGPALLRTIQNDMNEFLNSTDHKNVQSYIDSLHA